MHSLVVGPGLGRDPFTMKCTEEIIKHAKEMKIPIVIDGDGLWLISQKPQILKDSSNILLTPNIVEFGRLCDLFSLSSKTEDLPNLCKRLGGVTILLKGQTDWICDGQTLVASEEEGSPRRCGGQGDILAGAAAVFFTWAHKYSQDKGALSLPPGIIAGYGASLITRNASKKAFGKHLRGMTTPDVIEELPVVMETFFPVNSVF